MPASEEHVVKACGCGRTYTKSQWEQLPKLPEWVLDWGEVIELRNCACGSTIAMVLQEGDPV